jgi:hypothetical protein
MTCKCGFNGYNCDQGRTCPLQQPTTEPGELAPEREERSVPGAELVWIVLGILAFIAIGILA